jgi:NTE family protein
MSKLGLALGGGGARGLAHIGVLKILDKEKIKVASITGCSMGAIVGGLYAYLKNATEVEDFILKAIKNPKFANLEIDTFSKNKINHNKNYFDQIINYIGERINAIKVSGHVSYFAEEISNEIYELIPDIPIESLGIKFSAIATDLISGEEINFTHGSLRKAVKASSAIPGIFPPVEFNDRLLIDGSSSESVPVGRVKEIGADRVLAVDVSRCLKSINPPKNIIDILYRTEDITSHHLSIIRLKEADLVIQPKVKQLSWADFNKVNEIIKAGEVEATENLDKIKKLKQRNVYLLGMEQYFKKLKRDTEKEITN